MDAGKTRVPDPEARVPLTPAVFQILLALADRERHGYGIMREAEGNGGGKTKMGPGTLYGSIKRMLSEGLIEESDERPDPDLDDQRRRYYRITDYGLQVLGAETRRLEKMVGAAHAKRLPAGGARNLPERA